MKYIKGGLRSGHIIRQIISTHQILLLNYGRADTWYFSADTFDVTELHNTTKHYGPYTLHITIHQKDRINGTIRWVPPALKNETMVQALRIVSKLEPTVSEVPHTNNRSFTIFSDSPSTIPHYIKLNYKNTAINLLIAIPGRRQACQTCGSTRHWTSHCQILSEEAEQVHTIAITTANDASPGTSATQSEKSPESSIAQKTTIANTINPNTRANVTTPANTTPAAQQEKTKPLSKDNIASKTLPIPTQQEMETDTGSAKTKRKLSPTAELREITKTVKTTNSNPSNETRPEDIFMPN